jgi:hypothetical protein
MLDGVDGFVARDVGDFLLRGMQKVIRVYQLIDTNEEGTAKQELCASFSDALKDYRLGRQDEARRRFEQVLDQHPGDGPSEFYGRRCARPWKVGRRRPIRA